MLLFRQGTLGMAQLDFPSAFSKEVDTGYIYSVQYYVDAFQNVVLKPRPFNEL